METKFRKLKANEIEVRVQSANKGGAVLLLYKDARVDQNLLDETFGIFGWKRTHQLIGDRLYCTVAVKDPQTGEWVEKQDVGTESNTEKEKGQASDSFKRACFNLGIGRELYTAPNIFFPAEKLAEYKNDGGKYTCYDKFRVSDITYCDDTISSVTVECLKYGKVHSSMVFSNNKITEMPKTTPAPTATAKGAAKPAPQSATTEKTAAAPKAAPQSDSISDDEKIMIGNCRGKTYGEVKGSATFESFLNWIKSSNSKYPDPAQQRQFDIFKKMAQKGA